jgi:hypothetical protein
MRMKQAKVPIEVRRRAADHLESLRSSGMGSDVEDLYLGDDVVPIYRPDLDEPAYYEFPLLKATRKRPGGRTDLVDDIAKTNLRGDEGYAKVYASPGFGAGKQEAGRAASGAQGFITVATGEHDFPVPHWSLEQAPVSDHLEQEAKKKQKGVERIYKLDALAYLAEDGKGEQVSHVGELPFVVEEAPEDLSTFAGRIGSALPDDLERSEAPDLPKMRAKPLRQRGPRPPAVKLGRQKAWGRIKKEYARSNKPHLDALKKQAKRTWNIESAITEYGEGLRVGEPHNVLLLEKEFSVQVSGEAAEFVRVRVVDRPGGVPCVELTCRDPELGREASFDLHISYRGQRSEQLRFFVYSPEIPTRNPTDPQED